MNEQKEESESPAYRIKFVNYMTKKYEGEEASIIKVWGGLEDVMKKLHAQGRIIQARDDFRVLDEKKRSKLSRDYQRLTRLMWDVRERDPEFRCYFYRDVPKGEIKPLSTDKIHYLYKGSLVEVENNKFTYELRWNAKDIIVNSETLEKLINTTKKLGLLEKPLLDQDILLPSNLEPVVIKLFTDKNFQEKFDKSWGDKLMDLLGETLGR
jgi:hypothetical protein